MFCRDASKSFTNDTMLTAYTDRSRSPSPNLRIRPTDRKLSAPQPLLKVTPSIKHEPKLSLSSKLPLIKKKSRSLKEFHRLKSVHFNSPKAENRKTDRLDVNVSVI
uniref:TPX2_importin domain-containing protein n=1 Tax=Bursaphelenchus xylophilus TaxID=6326 RepID=A0A1I7SIL2_BURXY